MLQRVFGRVLNRAAKRWIVNKLSPEVLNKLEEKEREEEGYDTCASFYCSHGIRCKIMFVRKEEGVVDEATLVVFFQLPLTLWCFLKPCMRSWMPYGEVTLASVMEKWDQLEAQGAVIEASNDVQIRYIRFYRLL